MGDVLTASLDQWRAVDPADRSPDGVASQSKWLTFWMPEPLFEAVADAAAECGQSKRQWVQDLIRDHFGMYA